MTRSAYVLACVLACLSGGHAVPFDCETMTHLGLPTGCLLGLKTASYGTLAVCKDVLCRKLLTDTGGNAEWIVNPNGGCTLSPRGTQSVQDLICVSSSAIEPNPPAPEGDSGGITGGGVFLILFFVGGFVYFAGGMAYNFKMKELRGVEMVPNLEFWKDLPALVKDGALFVKNKATGGGGYSSV